VEPSNQLDPEPGDPEPGDPEPGDPELLEVDPLLVARWLAEESPLRIIDVREAVELVSGILPGAIHIPLGDLAMKGSMGLESAAGDCVQRQEPVLVYCHLGIRSRQAMTWLRNHGFEHCHSLGGGIEQWVSAGLSLSAGPGSEGLEAEQLERYARHLTIPEVGVKGQKKLLASSVLVVGGGGLGSPAALYLAAAGVGRITIADDDVVEPSNLQRQILFRSDEIGQSKAKVAARTLSALNPTIRIDALDERVTAANGSQLIRDHDVVIDGADNFETRFLINDLAVEERTPVVHGSVFRFEGQATVFDPARGGPCLRCLHPQPPPEGFCANCAEAGVLGVMPGIIGTIQAAEAIKWMLGQGVSMRGKLLIIDILNGVFRQISIPVNPLCTTCSQY
jgi:molybdopterin/thiamine biosynthesis adenylyltransferase/rhodanese-related sulfurtransferase